MADTKEPRPSHLETHRSRERWVQRATKAEAKIEDALALHVRGWTGFSDDGDRFPVYGCAHCKSGTWPCATVRALSDDALPGGA